MQLQQANLDVVKEPRGFIRCLELLFAIVAFSTLANFSTEIAINIICKSNHPGQVGPENTDSSFHQFIRDVVYPFKVNQIKPIDLEAEGPEGICGIKQWNVTDAGSTVSSKITFLGDFSSDAEFFVFTGVISFLYSLVSLLIYVWYPSLYQDPKKRNPKVDFLVSTVLAMFWLAGAAAWANGLGGLKWSCDTSNWLDRVSVCTKTSNTHAHHQYLYPKIEDCKGSAGSFGGATSAVLLGFLNFFLWTGNLWYLYKETAWFRGGAGASTLHEDRMEAGVAASSVEKEEAADTPDQEEEA